MGKSAFDIVARLNSWHVPKSGPASDITSYHVVCCVCIRYRSSDWAPYTCKRGMASFRPASYIQSIMCYFWCLIIWAVFISMSAYWRPTKLGTWNVFEGFNAQELHLVFLIAVHWIDRGYIISSIGLPWFNWSVFFDTGLQVQTSSPARPMQETRQDEMKSFVLHGFVSSYDHIRLGLGCLHFSLFSLLVFLHLDDLDGLGWVISLMLYG